MNKSDSIAHLASALASAQAEIRGAIKDAKNPHFKNDYASLESVIDAVRGPFAGHDLAYTQLLSDGGQDVLIETVLMHKSGEWLSSAFRIPATKRDPQGYGSAVTYGRRYALAALAGLTQVDDDGEAARVEQPRPISGAQVARDEFEALPHEAQQVVREWALEVIAFVENGKVDEAVAFIADKCPEHEDRLSVWSQLPSNIRSAIKKHKATT
jgi:ERF superfamily